MSINQIKHKQAGVGLLEVLIAVLVLSLGFLAAAKMQISGMRASQNAYFLSQANFMLRDMTDRMRANQTGVLAGHYKNTTTNPNTINPTCITAESKCSPADLAIADLHAWSKYLYEPAGAVEFKPLLPSLDTVTAKGEILYNDVSDVYTLNVKWGEQHKGVIEEQVLSVQLTP